MITVAFTDDEIRTLIQGLELAKDQYQKIYGFSAPGIVQEISLRVVQQSSDLLKKFRCCLNNRASTKNRLA